MKVVDVGVARVSVGATGSRRVAVASWSVDEHAPAAATAAAAPADTTAAVTPAATSSSAATSAAGAAAADGWGRARPLGSGEGWRSSLAPEIAALQLQHLRRARDLVGEIIGRLPGAGPAGWRRPSDLEALRAARGGYVVALESKSSLSVDILGAPLPLLPLLLSLSPSLSPLPLLPPSLPLCLPLSSPSTPSLLSLPPSADLHS